MKSKIRVLCCFFISWLVVAPCFSFEDKPPIEKELDRIDEDFLVVRKPYVERTGQMVSYVEGDDGDLQPGLPLPYHRFTDNEDGTVTDNATGLIWMKDADAIGISGYPSCSAFCGELADGTAGLTDGSRPGDWSVPTIKELESLIDFGNREPALPSEHPFSNVVHIFSFDSYRWYHSSTKRKNVDEYFINFSDGRIQPGYFMAGMARASHCWCVRGGAETFAASSK